MHYGLPALVQPPFTLIVKGELDHVYPVADAEPGIDDALDDSHDLVVGRLQRVVVEGGHWDQQLAQSFLTQHEVGQGHAEFELGVDCYLIQDGVKLFLGVLVEDESMLRFVRQVKLLVFTWYDWLEHPIVVHLRLYEGQHAVADAHYWKVLVFFLVVGLCPFQDALDGFREWVVSTVDDEKLGVARDVEAVKL